MSSNVLFLLTSSPKPSLLHLRSWIKDAISNNYIIKIISDTFSANQLAD